MVLSWQLYHGCCGGKLPKGSLEVLPKLLSKKKLAGTLSLSFATWKTCYTSHLTLATWSTGHYANDSDNKGARWQRWPRRGPVVAGRRRGARSRGPSCEVATRWPGPRRQELECLPDGVVGRGCVWRHRGSRVEGIGARR